jgi:hypothetical protein
MTIEVSAVHHIYVTDPDGIRLELVALRQRRELIRDHWHELTEFEDPLPRRGCYCESHTRRD